MKKIAYKVRYYDTRSGKEGVNTVYYPKSFVGKTHIAAHWDEISLYNYLRKKVAQRQYARDAKDIIMTHVEKVK